MQMNLTRLAGALILASALAGCAAVVKSPYQAPAVQMPADFQNSQALSRQVQAGAYADQWWTLFGDAQLNQLIQQAFNANSDLAVAGINLQTARLKAGLAQNKQGLRASSSAATMPAGPEPAITTRIRRPPR